MFTNQSCGSWISVAAWNAAEITDSLWSRGPCVWPTIPNVWVIDLNLGWLERWLWLENHNLLMKYFLRVPSKTYIPLVELAANKAPVAHNPRSTPLTDCGILSLSCAIVCLQGHCVSTAKPTNLIVGCYFYWMPIYLKSNNLLVGPLPTSTMRCSRIGMPLASRWRTTRSTTRLRQVSSVLESLGTSGGKIKYTSRTLGMGRQGTIFHPLVLMM